MPNVNVIPDKIQKQFPELVLVREQFNSEYEWRGQSENFSVEKIDENLLYRKGRVAHYDECGMESQGTEFYVVVCGMDLPVLPIIPMTKTPSFSRTKNIITIGECLGNHLPPGRDFFVVKVDFLFGHMANFSKFTIYKSDENSYDLVMTYFNELADWEQFTPQEA
jgi:hypothetical protein